MFWFPKKQAFTLIALSLFCFEIQLDTSSDIGSALKEAGAVLGLNASAASDKAAKKINTDAQSIKRGDLSSFGTLDLINISKNLDNHGWAVIDRIRNQTEFPADVFYNKTLHDLLPPDTVIRIKSIKNEYAIDAAENQIEQSDSGLKIETPETNKPEQVARRGSSASQDSTQAGFRRRGAPNSSATASSSDATVADFEKKSQSNVKKQKTFRYLCAQNLAGNYRLKAAHNNPEDPATRFVVKKFLNQNLESFIGIFSEVADGHMLRAGKNNEVILSRQSLSELIQKDGIKSNDNFSSDFDSDAHWSLYSKGVKPTDPIVLGNAKYLDVCSLKNRVLDAYFSVRSAADQSETSFYVKPACYWYWCDGDGLWTSSRIVRQRAGPASAARETDYENTIHYFQKRKKFDRDNLIPLDGVGSIQWVFSPPRFHQDNNRSFLGSSAPGERFGGEIRQSYQTAGRNGKNRDESMRLDSNDNGALNPVNQNFYPKIFNKAEELFFIYNNVRHYAYYSKVNYLDKASELLIDPKNEQSGIYNIANKKNEVRYGDKVRIASTLSGLTLYAINDDYSDAQGMKMVFGSHDDTEKEFNKINKINQSYSTTPDINTNKSRKNPADLGFFYIKGPHQDQDRWNCKVGDIVKDGDSVRFEHCESSKNLSIAKGQQPPKSKLRHGKYLGSPAVVDGIEEGLSGSFAYDKDQKPAAHENRVILNGENGVGSSSDNFIIKINKPVSDSLVVAQPFNLIHQNTRLQLWSQHAFFPAMPASDGSDNCLGLVSVLKPETTEQVSGCPWVIMSATSEGLPVKDVVWCGVPDGGKQDSVTDQEELSIEIVKLGLSGNLGSGETISVNMPAYKKEPKVAGYAKDKIDQFGVDTIVTLNPLKNNGVAWLEESLKTPNKTGLLFRAKANDDGNIQVYLGTSLTLDYIWKVVIGGGNNSSSYILKKEFIGGSSVEKKVYEVFKAQNPIACAVPGQYQPYWLTIDDGLIMLGVGQSIGENIILCWKDFDQREPVSRIGFGSNEKPISYAEVLITNPIKLKNVNNFYYQSEQPQEGSNKLLSMQKNNQVIPIELKVPGNACLSFNVKGSTNVYLFEDDSNKKFLALTDDTLKTNILSEKVAALEAELTRTIEALSLQQIYAVNADFNDIINYFIKRPEHFIKKFFDGLPAADKKDQKNAALKIFLNDIFSGDQIKIQNYSLATIQDNISQILNLLLKSKLLQDSDFAVVKNDEATKNIILDLFKGNKKIKNLADQNQKNPVDIASLIQEDAIAKLVALYRSVNNHYRISFQNLADVLEKAKEFEDNLSAVLKTYFKAFCSLLITKADISTDSINDVIRSLSTALNQAIKTIKYNSLDTEIIYTRLRSSSAQLKELASVGFEECFNKIFSAPMIAYIRQTLKEATDACIKIEKYSPSTDSYEVLCSSKSFDSSEINFSSGKDVWLMISKSKMFLGLGQEVGENLLMYAWDLKNPYNNVQNIAVEKGSISNLKIGNAPNFAYATEQQSYSTGQNAFDYKGSLIVLSPYEYHISQEDQQVKFQDILNKKTYFPGKTPQQGALYYFTLMLEQNGFPTLVWTKEPENALKIEIDKQAALHKAKSDALYQASTYVQGMGAIGGLVGVAASITFAGAGVGEGFDAAKLSAESQSSFRAADAYVYTDSVQNVAPVATDSIPPQIKQNRDLIRAELETGGKWIASDIDKLQRLIPLYARVINLITHPYTIEGQQELIFSGIESIYRAHSLMFKDAKTSNDTLTTHYSMLGLLVKAYNNPYLINPTKDKSRKIAIYSYINDLAAKLINSSENSEVTIPPCYGEYIWVPSKFKTPNKGSISFKVKANNDVFVSFSNQPVNVRNSDEDLYEVVLGAWNNDRTVIRAKSLDKSVAETKNPEALVNPIDYKKFWISFNNGRIVLGTQDLSPENAIGIYDPKTRKITKPSWESYSQEITPSQEWLTEVIGSEDGAYYGKDFLLEKLKTAKSSDEKAVLTELIKDRQSKITALLERKIQPFSAEEKELGYYNQPPFMWEDIYFDSETSNISNVGLSSWDSEVSFKEIYILPCVEDTAISLKNIKAQINNKNNASIFYNEPLAKEYKDKTWPIMLKKYESENSLPLEQTQEIPKPKNETVEAESSESEGA